MPKDAIHRYIAKQIRTLAKQQGWSGNRLADTAGVSRAQLSRLLTLQTSPTIGLLKKIAAALDVDTRDLLGRLSTTPRPLVPVHPAPSIP